MVTGLACGDCALWVANRELPDSSPDWSPENVSQGEWVIGDHEEEFSPIPCVICGTTVAGDRWEATDMEEGES